jgi:hypothetical protein
MPVINALLLIVAIGDHPERSRRVMSAFFAIRGIVEDAVARTTPLPVRRAGVFRYLGDIASKAAIQSAKAITSDIAHSGKRSSGVFARIRPS